MGWRHFYLIEQNVNMSLSEIEHNASSLFGLVSDRPCDNIIVYHL